jgi:hypothetical protein
MVGGLTSSLELPWSDVFPRGPLRALVDALLATLLRLSLLDSRFHVGDRG